MSVLILHSHDLFDAPLTKLPVFSDFGWVGVRLFFVISGFIVADRICKCVNLGDYLTRRFLRVFPLYFVISSFAVLMAVSANKLLFVLPKTDSGLPFEPSWPLYFIKSVLILPQDEWPLFAVGWSLEFEIIFYALFGLAYFSFGALAARLIILGLAIAGLLNILPGNHIAHPFMFYFFAGCLSRDAFHSYRRASYWIALVAFLPATVLWISHLYGIQNIGISGFTIATAISFSSLLILSLGLEPYLGRVASNSRITLIGDASFSIYLCHWLVFRAFRSLTYDIETDLLVMEAIRILIIAGTILLSISIHRRIEGPMNKLALQRARKFQLPLASRSQLANSPDALVNDR